MKRSLSPVVIVVILVLAFIIFSVIYGILRDTSTNQAWKACEQAQEVQADSFSGQVFAVVKLNDNPTTKAYTVNGQDIQLSEKLSTAGAVLCMHVVDDKQKTCFYEGAHTIEIIGTTLEAKLIRWPDGALIAQTTTVKEHGTCPASIWCKVECEDIRYYAELPKNWVSGFMK